MTVEKKRVRVAVIGTGFGRRVQIPGFQASDRAEVVAVCSRREERAAQAAREFGVPCFYTDYEELLASEELDLVSIVTPPHLHEPMAVQALETGRHVLCEKPMALNISQARYMWNVAEQSGQVHAIDHEMRFHPNRRRMKQLLDAGHLGRPFQAIIIYFSNFRADSQTAWDWWSNRSEGGGALGAVGSHEIDLLRWWFGEIESVSAHLQASIPQRPGPDGSPRLVTADDAIALLLMHISGASSQVIVSNVAWGTRREGTWIFCENGSLELRGHDQLILFEPGHQEGQDISQPDSLSLPPEMEDRAPTRAFVRLADHLCQVITDGVPQEGATFEDGLRTQEVMDAAHLAMVERRWVQVSEVATI